MEYIDILKKLKIPFDRKIFNFPMSHYKQLAEDLGYAKINSLLRELVVYYKHDKIMSEKTRIIIRNLNRLITEKKADPTEECECGFLLLGQEYIECPVCKKPFYTGKGCFYKEDNYCTLDGQDCKWNKQNECGKLDE